ncbi:MAG: peptide/nickel transport system substrate-binding protein [Thermomicrobiales bacterium]|jgi:peptide/nickel transport system substrate-binding protein|nr:peptide/nickel transport system substrate-binding protein [Thermomicrobiales bacterium]
MSDPTRSQILAHSLSRRALLKTAAAGGAAGLALPATNLGPASVAAQGTGGTLTAMMYQSIPSPWQMQGTAVWTCLVFETLVAWDENYSQIVPALAESWTTSEDGLVYTFKLRQGVTWHDGQPFTAADVVWSYATILHPTIIAASGSWLSPNLKAIKGAAAYSEGTVKELEGAKAPDELTVELTIEKPSPLFLKQVAMPWILPKHLLGEVPLDTLFDHPYFSEQLVGTGPFKFQEWEREQFITVVRNDAYYRGAPKLDSIVARKVDQPSVAILSQQNGELDAIDVRAPEDIEAVKKDANLDVFPGPGMLVQTMGVGNKPEILKDKRVRQAILHAIDRQTIVDSLYKGTAEIVNTPFVVDWVPMDGVNPYPYDPDKAKALLAEAGWDANVTLDIWAYYLDPFTGQLLAAFQQYLSDVGIKTAVQQTDFANIEADYNAGNFGLLYQGSARGPDPDQVYIYFHSKSEYNTLYSDPEVDRLLDEGRNTLDEAERAKIYNQLAIQLADQSFWLTLWSPLRHWSVVKSVTGTHGKMGTPGLHIPFYSASETWTKA